MLAAIAECLVSCGWLSAAAPLLALSQTEPSTHVAAVVKRGKLLSVGTNRSRAGGAGGGAFSEHAERAAVRALGDLSQLRGADLYVVRLPRGDAGCARDLLYSRPCADCTVFLEKCMRVWGLRRVLYTTDMTMALSPPPLLPLPPPHPCQGLAMREAPVCPFPRGLLQRQQQLQCSQVLDVRPGSNSSSSSIVG